MTHKEILNTPDIARPPDLEPSNCAAELLIHTLPDAMRVEGRLVPRNFDMYDCEPCRWRFVVEHAPESGGQRRMRWAGPLSKDHGKKPYSETAEYNAARNRRREAWKRRNGATFTEEDWRIALTFFDHRCAYCGADAPLQEDHFIPLSFSRVFSRARLHSAGNIVPACAPCNMRKGRKSPKWWCQPDTYQHIVAFLEGRAYDHLMPMMRQLREDRQSLERIAARLNELGHPMREGGTWNRRQVKRVLDRNQGAPLPSPEGRVE